MFNKFKMFIELHLKRKSLKSSSACKMMETQRIPVAFRAKIAWPSGTNPRCTRPHHPIGRRPWINLGSHALALQGYKGLACRSFWRYPLNNVSVRNHAQRSVDKMIVQIRAHGTCTIINDSSHFIACSASCKLLRNRNRCCMRRSQEAPWGWNLQAYSRRSSTSKRKHSQNVKKWPNQLCFVST